MLRDGLAKAFAIIQALPVLSGSLARTQSTK